MCTDFYINIGGFSGCTEFYNKIGGFSGCTDLYIKIVGSVCVRTFTLI